MRLPPWLRRHAPSHCCCCLDINGAGLRVLQWPVSQLTCSWVALPLPVTYSDMRLLLLWWWWVLLLLLLLSQDW